MGEVDGEAAIVNHFGSRIRFIVHQFASSFTFQKKVEDQVELAGVGKEMDEAAHFWRGPPGLVSIESGREFSFCDCDVLGRLHFILTDHLLLDFKEEAIIDDLCIYKIQILAELTYDSLLEIH